MSNKTAPYKDPKIIELFTDFYDKSQSEISNQSRAFAYRSYLEYMATNNRNIELTLNYPQFLKVMDIVEIVRAV